MQIFISWSGERSQAMAKALHEWLPIVLHYACPWLSGSDIQPGERWSVEVAKKLGEINFGILCITRENLNSPWILFEAGALAKSMQEGRVIPLLLDLDFQEIAGPLAQFQAKKAENAGIKELVTSLNKAAVAPVPDANLEKLFSMAWGDLEQRLLAIPKKAAPVKQTRQQGEILEELVSSVRSVEMRVREVTDEGGGYRRRRVRKTSPMLYFDLVRRLEEGPSDPISILILSSVFREEAPWLYEIALEVYRCVKDGRLQEASSAYRKFRDAVEFLRLTPLGEELGIDVKEFHYLLRESMIQQSLFDFPEPGSGKEVRVRMRRPPPVVKNQKDAESS